MSSPKSIFTARVTATGSQPSLKSPSRCQSSSEYRAVSSRHSRPQYPHTNPVRTFGAWPQNPSIESSSSLEDIGGVTGKKRSFEYVGPAPEPFPKKPKLRHIYKHTLDGFDFSGPYPFNFAQPTSAGPGQPPSPLFFSNSTLKRPSLPPRFSSGEAGERMLRQADAEETKVRTVKLARASYSGASPPAVGIPSYRGSLERTAIADTASPEVCITLKPCFDWMLFCV